ncbi:c-type cytochrome [Marinimicrobium alkaliphilum]|uniref:c-type cytochrome n=1 Tax=Marinimicrobium alkaliphilum TaxID=2202654 RepID=UPI000DBA3F4C|nr:c-type cytochrome [Marinimicrobium alkaliphilum]
MKQMIRLMLVVALGMSTLAFAQSDRLSEAMQQRLAPVGTLCMEGEDCAAAPTAAASDEPRSGGEIYDAHCATCHAAGVAGAPIMGDADSWADVFARDIDEVYANAINGIGGMPAMGLCMNCSEEEIRVTVDYMIEQSQ